MKIYEISKKRNIAVLCLILILSLSFLAYLFNIQIIDVTKESETVVSTVEVSVDAVRGNILDRNGYPLVTNRQVNKIVFTYLSFPTDYSERNVIINALIKLFDKNGVQWHDNLPIKLSSKGKLSFSEDKENEISYLKSEAFLDLNYYADVEDCFNALVTRYHLEEYTLKEQRAIASVYYSMVKNGFNTGRDYEFATDVSSALISVIMEKSDLFTGVNVKISSEREYTDGTVAPHILGMVGPITTSEYETKKEQGYTINDIIGKSGVESAMESYLRGVNGVKTITTDSAGNTAEEYTTLPTDGNTVILTVDYELQKVAQTALADCIASLQETLKRPFSLTGAVVVMGVETGEVLAMASYPSYDNSTYSENADELNNDIDKPLWNRALRSTYTPGSAIKPAVAMAGLEEGVITSSTVIKCKHIYTHYEDYQPKCTGYHLGQNVINALYNSCNIFFYETARLLGIDKLNSYFAMFGLGEKTGVELYESTGTVDSPTLRTSLGELWTPGLTVQAGIGHGNNQFTPMQLCSYAATIANRGIRYKAHIIKSVKTADLSETVLETEKEILSQADFAQSNWDLVYRGMYLVGSNNIYLSKAPVSVAAKTGTTTVSKSVGGRTIETNNGILISFAPYDDPEIAVAVVVEGASSGSSTAPVVRDIMNYYFSSEDAQENFTEENVLLK